MNKKKEEVKPVMRAVAQPAKIDFDAWWAMNEKKIPVQHRKEIVLADMRARGLGLRETVQSYNDALKRYGVRV